MLNPSWTQTFYNTLQFYVLNFEPKTAHFLLLHFLMIMEF